VGTGAVQEAVGARSAIEPRRPRDGEEVEHHGEGAPWKLPLEATVPSSSTTGLSMADASSYVATVRAWASVSRAAPFTCGAQRTL